MQAHSGLSLLSMNDALKLLFGAVGGFIVGVLTEPIKLSFQRSSKIRQMTVAVYREIAINYDGLVSRVKHQTMLQEGHHMYVNDITRNDTILKQVKSDILYAQIAGIKPIEGFYLQLSSLKGKGERPEDWADAKGVLDIINMAFKTKQLNRKLMQSFLPPESRKRFHNMLRLHWSE